MTPETLQMLDQHAFVILPALLVAEQLGIPLRRCRLCWDSAPWRRTDKAAFHWC